MIVRNNTVLNEKHTVLTCKDKNNNLFYSNFFENIYFLRMQRIKNHVLYFASFFLKQYLNGVRKA